MTEDQPVSDEEIKEVFEQPETTTGNLKEEDVADVIINTSLLSSKADVDAVLEAIQELTKVCADLAVKVNGMKESHDKWVRSGKF